MAKFVIISLILLFFAKVILFVVLAKKYEKKCSGCQFAATCSGKDSTSKTPQNPSGRKQETSAKK
ncbi:MAG: hypothetical protein IIW10_05805 [Spirochaetaceae bacterium]|nr:hypothetical protein [Spirochaetaceae bacterium]